MAANVKPSFDVRMNYNTENAGIASIPDNYCLTIPVIENSDNQFVYLCIGRNPRVMVR